MVTLCPPHGYLIFFCVHTREKTKKIFLQRQESQSRLIIAHDKENDFKNDDYCNFVIITHN